MKHFKLSVIIILLNIYFTSSKLISVIEINRHGARAPSNFPEKSKKMFFGSFDMQLSINGFSQLEILGRYVHNKYINELKLLSPKYDSSEFLMIASPTQRTIFSASVYLACLYSYNIV